MRYITVFIIVFIAVISSFAQDSFYKTDSVFNYGAKIIDNGLILNAIQCEVELKPNKIILSPDEVVEYGFNDGRVYVSKQIQMGDSIKRVFLLQLVVDETTLYVYHGKGHKIFYIEKDSTLLIELPKYNQENKKVDFKEKLSTITADCQYISDAIMLVTYNAKPLSKLIKNYNNCSAEPFPFFKYGFILGCGFRNIEFKGNNFSEYKDFVNNRYKSSILPGFFIDCPIEMSNFSLHTEIYLSRYRYSFSKTSTSNVLDFVANTTSIHLPVLLRYTLPEMNFRPFVNGGLNVNCNMQNNTILYNTLITPDYIELLSIDTRSYISKFQFGFSVGAGFEYKLNYKRSVFIEFRYNKQLSNSSTYSFNSTQLELLTGLNI